MIIHEDGRFTLRDPFPSLYLPIANQRGMLGSVTPELAGDSKLDQNTFLLEPATRESLREGKGSRNFWCLVKGKQPWSATGRSAWQQLREEAGDAVTMEGGLLWQHVTRENASIGLRAQVLSFVPEMDTTCECMQVFIENISDVPLALTAVVAIPIYGRSADNLRDHRHVTSLLSRAQTTEYGVTVTPTLSFDERGHQQNHTQYGIYAAEGAAVPPEAFCPVQDDFTGEYGSLEWPQALTSPAADGFVPAGYTADGYETIGAIRFGEVTLQPGERRTYQILLSIDTPEYSLLDASAMQAAFAFTCGHWERRTLSLQTGDATFDAWMRWVSIQPELRRLYGCSFLPHHDYGRGGRGWRDLWQDCLALLLVGPDTQRDRLIAYLGGVRIDGSNATIIGNEAGSFLADRNHIVRMWMDHGVWPTRTIMIYLHQTGDAAMLLSPCPYFKDTQAYRSEALDGAWTPDQGTLLLDARGNAHQGSVLEHLLVQNVTAFFDVGEHNHIRLRGADWNDALDMARQRGESVAFTAAYADNLSALADVLAWLDATGTKSIQLIAELDQLLTAAAAAYDEPATKQALLKAYCQAVLHTVSGKTTTHDALLLAATLRRMANWLTHHIRQTEWTGDGKEHSWFNGYYDENGRQVEGLVDGRPRMMLTGQVFTLLSGIATDAQAEAIIRASDTYLYAPERGGYALNTDFGEIKLDLGRMFGFAYGHKENGAVFSHMAVMYAYALYHRGYAAQGYKALHALYTGSMAYDQAKMLPGLPEYFDMRGRGMYPYLTGSASWYWFTVQTEMFGVKGHWGDLRLKPQLVPAQFDASGKAAITVSFADRTLHIRYDHGKPESSPRATLAGQSLPSVDGSIAISRKAILALAENETHVIEVYL